VCSGAGRETGADADVVGAAVGVVAAVPMTLERARLLIPDFFLAAPKAAGAGAGRDRISDAGGAGAGADVAGV